MLDILLTAIRLYELAMILHIILTWVVPPNERQSNKFFKFVDSITEPVLKPIRVKLVKVMPMLMNFRVDITPIIVFFALSILEGVVKIIF